jgi:hypothetical protein
MMNAKVSFSRAHLFSTVLNSSRQSKGTVSRNFLANLNIKERMSDPALIQREITAAIGIVNAPFHAICIFPLSHMEEINGRMRQIIGYFISCSKLVNRSLLKKSLILIPSPSHNFLIVTIPALYVVPFTISFTVDCVTPEILLRALMVKFLSMHNSSIRLITA